MFCDLALRSRVKRFRAASASGRPPLLSWMYTPIRLIPWAVMLSKFLNVDEETGIGIYEFATANYVGVWGT